MKNVAIVGLGEIGKPIKQIEEEAGNKIFIFEINNADKPESIDVMHICIPYGKEFEYIVENYIKSYNPKLTIIHSTVKIGTTKKIQEETEKLVVHSPIRGIHPNLYEGIKTFTKYVGGDDESCKEAIKHLKSLELEPIKLGCSKTTELAKILSTTYYGWNILFAKEAQRLCTYYDLDYDKIYSHPNTTYNEGYNKLGKKNVIRPVLIPPINKIGGHCITQNVELLPNLKLKQIFKQLNEND